MANQVDDLLIRQLVRPPSELYAPVTRHGDVLVKLVLKPRWGGPLLCAVTCKLLVLDMDGIDLNEIRARLAASPAASAEHWFVHQTPRGFHLYLMSSSLLHNSARASQLRVQMGCDPAHGCNSHHTGVSLRLSRKAGDMAPPSVRVGELGSSLPVHEACQTTYNTIVRLLAKYGDFGPDDLASPVSRGGALVLAELMPIQDFGTVHMESCAPLRLARGHSEAWAEPLTKFPVLQYSLPRRWVDPLPCGSCGRRGHVDIHCPFRGKCFRCGEEGHEAASCPNRDRCYRCGEHGHWVAQCTKEPPPRESNPDAPQPPHGPSPATPRESTPITPASESPAGCHLCGAQVEGCPKCTFIQIARGTERGMSVMGSEDSVGLADLAVRLRMTEHVTFDIWSSTADYAVGLHVQETLVFMSYRDLLMADFDDDTGLAVVKARALAHPAECWRLVRTRRGYHAFLTSKPIPYHSHQAREILRDLQSDRMHALGSRVRGYSVRLNLKPEDDAGKAIYEELPEPVGDPRVEDSRLHGLYEMHLRASELIAPHFARQHASRDVALHCLSLQWPALFDEEVEVDGAT